MWLVQEESGCLDKGCCFGPRCPGWIGEGQFLSIPAHSLAWFTVLLSLVPRGTCLQVELLLVGLAAQHVVGF